MVPQTHQLHLVVVVFHQDTRKIQRLCLLFVIHQMLKLEGLYGILPEHLQLDAFPDPVEPCIKLTYISCHFLVLTNSPTTMSTS